MMSVRVSKDRVGECGSVVEPNQSRRGIVSVRRHCESMCVHIERGLCCASLQPWIARSLLAAFAACRESASAA